MTPKSAVYFNPRDLHGLPSHRMNPLGHIRWSSPTLIPDLKVAIENLRPRSGAQGAVYFEESADRISEALGLIVTKIDGELTLPGFYKATTALVRNDGEWRDIAWEMHSSGIELCRSVEAEIHAAREDSSGGFKGIIGEIQRAVACLSDPQLLDALSPPYDFDLADLCSEDHHTQLYLMVPPDMISPWKAVLKSFFVRAVTEKSRKPQAKELLLMLDECGQLEGFPLVPKLFTYGAGIGVKPFAVFQSFRQMDNVALGAERIIPSSAALQMYFGIRDLDTARTVSAMLGDETLGFDDELTQSRAKAERLSLLQKLMGGGDPFQLSHKLRQKSFESDYRRKIRRSLMTPDELLRLPGDRMLVFADNLPGAIFAQRRPYWDQPFMAGRYHPNPYHPPLDRVTVTDQRGRKHTRPVITEPVPDEYAHLPQYRDGMWSHIGEVKS